MKKLLIWGAGDQGIVTLDCAIAMNLYSQIDFLNFKEKKNRDIKNYSIYQENEEELEVFLKAYDEVIVASGDNQLRKNKIAILESYHIPLATIVHPSAIISPFAKVSKGCTILANAVVNINAFIGIGCIINTAVVVEHDCVVNDFVNISPQSSMAGHTIIGSQTFLGIGCTIIDDIKVGENVIAGGGTVIIKDIPDNVMVVGIPAKIIRQL